RRDGKQVLLDTLDGRQPRHRERERKLDRELEPGRDASGADAELAAVVGEANQASADECRRRRQGSVVSRERRQHAADDSEQDEKDSSPRRRPRLLLMAVGQLLLDDLTRPPLLEGPDRQRVKDERDSKGDRESQNIEHARGGGDGRANREDQPAVSSPT